MTDLHAQLAEIIEASMDNTNDMDVTFADFANAAATAILAEVKALFEPPSQAVPGVTVNPSGFNDALERICADRCADCGDPPCWKLPDLVEPCEHITPCEECLAELEDALHD